MDLKQLSSHQELLGVLEKDKDAHVLLYKKNSELSDCALKNIVKAKNEGVALYVVDVSEVRDIHPVYNISSVPTLLKFNDGVFQKVFKGCNPPEFYQSIFENKTATVANGEPQKKHKSVTVYSTPSCSWCNKLKQYLRESNIPFRDVDVSKDASAAQNLVKQTGQQGVPQTNINGQWIVGFDKPKIDRLLGING